VEIAKLLYGMEHADTVGPVFLEDEAHFGWRLPNCCAGWGMLNCGPSIPRGQGTLRVEIAKLLCGMEHADTALNILNTQLSNFEPLYGPFGGRSVGIVHLWTKGHRVCLYGPFGLG
jgi:hypothetical protein